MSSKQHQRNQQWRHNREDFLNKVHTRTLSNFNSFFSNLDICWMTSIYIDKIVFLLLSFLKFIFISKNSEEIQPLKSTVTYNLWINSKLNWHCICDFFLFSHDVIIGRPLIKLSSQLFCFDFGFYQPTQHNSFLYDVSRQTRNQMLYKSRQERIKNAQYAKKTHIFFLFPFFNFGSFFNDI
jgi:hypothetical protein